MELRAVKLKIQSPQDCEDSWNSFSFLENIQDYEVNRTLKLSFKYSEKYREMFLKDYEICIKQGDKDACQGDSGGPLVCNGNTFHTVINKNVPWAFVLASTLASTKSIFIDSNNILLSSAEDGKSVLHGVTSWGLGCAIPTFPGGIFANVYALRNFVKNIIVRSDNYI